MPVKDPVPDLRPRRADSAVAPILKCSDSAAELIRCECLRVKYFAADGKGVWFVSHVGRASCEFAAMLAFRLAFV